MKRGLKLFALTIAALMLFVTINDLASLSIFGG